MDLWPYWNAVKIDFSRGARNTMAVVLIDLSERERANDRTLHQVSMIG
jgi:hypothetical protein